MVEEGLHKGRVAIVTRDAAPVTIEYDFLHGWEARAAERLEVRLNTRPVLLALRRVDRVLPGVQANGRKGGETVLLVIEVGDCGEMDVVVQLRDSGAAAEDAREPVINEVAQVVPELNGADLFAKRLPERLQRSDVFYGIDDDMAQGGHRPETGLPHERGVQVEESESRKSREVDRGAVDGEGTEAYISAYRQVLYVRCVLEDISKQVDTPGARRLVEVPPVHPLQRGEGRAIGGELEAHVDIAPVCLWTLADEDFEARAPLENLEGLEGARAHRGRARIWQAGSAHPPATPALVRRVLQRRTQLLRTLDEYVLVEQVHGPSSPLLAHSDERCLGLLRHFLILLLERHGLKGAVRSSVEPCRQWRERGEAEDLQPELDWQRGRHGAKASHGAECEIGRATRYTRGVTGVETPGSSDGDTLGFAETIAAVDMFYNVARGNEVIATAFCNTRSCYLV